MRLAQYQRIEASGDAKHVTHGVDIVMAIQELIELARIHAVKTRQPRAGFARRGRFPVALEAETAGSPGVAIADLDLSDLASRRLEVVLPLIAKITFGGDADTYSIHLYDLRTKTIGATVAEAPGYDLYNAAARDTLKLASWPGRVLAEPSTRTSPSAMSMARLVLPSRLELNRPEGSSSEAPLAKVSFTLSL